MSDSLKMDSSQKLPSYNSATAAATPSIGTERLLRYLPKKQSEVRKVAIDIPETGNGQLMNQDVLKAGLTALERGMITCGMIYTSIT